VTEVNQFAISKTGDLDAVFGDGGQYKRTSDMQAYRLNSFRHVQSHVLFIIEIKINAA
jgi:hypothetical protein